VYRYCLSQLDGRLLCKPQLDVIRRKDDVGGFEVRLNPSVLLAAPPTTRHEKDFTMLTSQTCRDDRGLRRKLGPFSPFSAASNNTSSNASLAVAPCEHQVSTKALSLGDFPIV
jgi:hypothetical protein